MQFVNGAIRVKLLSAFDLGTGGGSGLKIGFDGLLHQVRLADVDGKQIVIRKRTLHIDDLLMAIQTPLNFVDTRR